MQSFVCIYSISEKHRFVKRYLENKTQDIVSKTYYYSYKSVYIVLSFSSLLSLSSVLSLHEGIVFFVFASFRLAVCPVDFFPMGETEKTKNMDRKPFYFFGVLKLLPRLESAVAYPPPGALSAGVALCGTEPGKINRKSTPIFRTI